jgi:hypothetical protein
MDGWDVVSPSSSCTSLSGEHLCSSSSPHPDHTITTLSTQPHSDPAVTPMSFGTPRPSPGKNQAILPSRARAAPEDAAMLPPSRWRVTDSTQSCGTSPDAHSVNSRRPTQTWTYF